MEMRRRGRMVSSITSAWAHSANERDERFVMVNGGWHIAKLAISIARKMNALIFLVPEDIVDVRPRLVSWSAIWEELSADDRSWRSLELCGLVHYSSRALLGIDRGKERKGKRVVKNMNGWDKGRIVYFVYSVCYAIMLPYLHCTDAMLLDCLPDVCMISERTLTSIGKCWVDGGSGGSDLFTFSSPPSLYPETTYTCMIVWLTDGYQ